MSAALDILRQADVQAFVKAHENNDVRELALKKPPNADWPYPLILDQIKARQKSRTKMPDWLDTPDIILPPADIIEQASSTATANYKARLVGGDMFADLTGGAGVDCQALTQNFSRGICAERNPDAAALLAHNLPHLTETPIEIHTGKAEDVIKDVPPVDLVYLDPQRRDERRKGYINLGDYSPDITALLPILKQKAARVMIKTSPMLDITQAVTDLQYVQTVHVVEWHGECKEVLYILDFANPTPSGATQIHAVTIDDTGAPIHTHIFTPDEEKATNAIIGAPQTYLYEPGPAFLKAGAFNTLARTFSLKKLHTSTHLYTNNTIHTDFPGKIFEIKDTLPVSRKALPVKKANLAVRNFPDTAENLKKKLALKDGGEDYIFACTDEKNRKILLHCRKLG